MGLGFDSHGFGLWVQVVGLGQTRNTARSNTSTKLNSGHTAANTTRGVSPSPEVTPQSHLWFGCCTFSGRCHDMVFRIYVYMSKHTLYPSPANSAWIIKSFHQWESNRLRKFHSKKSRTKTNGPRYVFSALLTAWVTFYLCTPCVFTFFAISVKNDRFSVISGQLISAQRQCRTCVFLVHRKLRCNTTLNIYTCGTDRSVEDE